jgi:ATP-dependent DNA helicase RecQ
VAAWLQGQGIAARAYHADCDGGEREALEQDLLANRVKALVATVALGMGFDKPDLGFVVHFQRPGSVVAYYQQVGRAGRAVEKGYGFLLSGTEEDEIHDYFLGTAFPSTELMQQLLAALSGAQGLTLHELLGVVNVSFTMAEKALKLLEIDGAVGRNGRHFFRTPNSWQPDQARQDRVIALRHAERAQMTSTCSIPDA